jgi:predicted RNA-binding Zn-ribbon protein involved in translation (DUF1610 family)
MKQATIEKYTAIAEANGWKADRDDNTVFVPCGRCGGQGTIYFYGHVEGGICFGCRGGKGGRQSLVTLGKRADAAQKRADKKVRVEEAKREAARVKALAFLESRPELWEAFVAAPEGDPRRDMAEKLERWGSLSDKQVAFALTLHVRQQEKESGIEAPKGSAPEGREQIEGNIVGMKEYDGDYGTVLKILVQCEDEQGAYKVFVSFPRGLNVHPNGDHETVQQLADRKARVRLTATWTRKEADFATGKRPAKAELLDFPDNGTRLACPECGEDHKPGEAATHDIEEGPTGADLVSFTCPKTGAETKGYVVVAHGDYPEPSETSTAAY